MWVPNNLIAFNESNKAYFKNQENNDNVKKNNIKIVDISHEFKEKSGNENEDENFDENLAQSEETSDVIEVENLDVIKTKEKRNTWSVNETRALIGAIEARYDDMYHIHKRKNFWIIISEELSSQNIEVSKIIYIINDNNKKTLKLCFIVLIQFYCSYFLLYLYYI